MARRGTALALSLVVVTVVAMLGAGFLQVTSALTARQASAVDTHKAFYLAEAGLAESFQAVRMGRTGQVASAEAPVRYGDGLVWVDVVELEDGTVRLDSNGLCGTGRSSLSLVVEPVEIALGFFADEDLVVDSVLLLDGFSSEDGGYAPAEPSPDKLFIDPSYPFLHDDPWTSTLFYEGTFYRYSSYQENWIDIDQAVSLAELVRLDAPLGAFDLEIDDFTDADWENDYQDVEYAGVLSFMATMQGGVLEPSLDLLSAFASFEPPLSDPMAPEEPAAEVPTTEAPTESLLGPTTGEGGLLGSNGSIHFTLPEGVSAEIWGDVEPGRDGSVTGLDSVLISGDTSPRVAQVELPEVVLPIVAQAPPLRYDDLLPMLIPGGSSGYERIEVAPDAELVIRGPATVLVGSLILEPGALLTLDTRAGEVALYVTGELDLQAGASVVTSGTDPGEMSLQVASTANDPTDPAVKLDANASFHGTVYAPRTDVRIGSDFEIFGGVVAERLEIAAGARLHFDKAGFGDSALPRIVGWRLIEVPEGVRSLGRDPIRSLGLDASTLPDLSSAHDLGHVQLDIEYLDTVGVARTFSGLEDQFDWSGVGEIVEVEREPTRVKAEPGGDGPGAEPETPPVEGTSGIRTDVDDALATLGGAPLKEELISKSPLSDEEAVAVIDAMKMTSSEQMEALLASSPLGDATLIRLVDGISTTNSSDLEALLLASSPLSERVLDRVAQNDFRTLTAPDQARILDANDD